VDRVDLSGKRVAVIGTGSSGIQVIPVLAEQAAELTVFQRTPAFTLPAKNGPAPAHRRRMLAEDRDGYRNAARWSSGGVPMEPPSERAADLSPEEQVARLEHAWNAGEIAEINSVFADHLTNKAANDIFADFLRQKIRSIVDDPRTADVLCPTDYPFMAKRPCFGTGYYEVFNESHVRLVDLRRQPIARITTSGLDTTAESFEFDVIVFATGYDALTGALTTIDIVGRDGVVLRDKWQAGPATYLGLTSAGFPNLFMITGPGSPSVLSNMVVSIEQHVDWIARCLDDLREQGFDVIEATPKAEIGWVQHVNDCADVTLFPTANSWYVGANVPGKPRVFMPYVGGVGVYKATCETVIDGGYLGFRLEGPAGTRTSDVVVNRLQPDVAEIVRELEHHPASEFHTMAVDEARKVVADFWRVRDPRSPKDQPVTGTVTAGDGVVGYRLFRAPADQPRPLIAWVSGAGWVFDDPTTESYCRDLAERTGCTVAAVEPPRSPESSFPSAVEAVTTAVRWFAQHPVELGGLPGRLVLAGWDSGANLAASAAVTLCDEGVDVAGCLFIDPIVELHQTGELFTNTEARWPEHPQLEWLIGQYVDADSRHDPTASPLRASLRGFPPAVIAVGELGTLRKQGETFAYALEEAGSSAQLLVARGHAHGSLVRVDLLSGNAPRAEVADAVLRLLDATNAHHDGAVARPHHEPVRA
jgi:cation diffusion facilitator CzcD-associated flavoprotein CzcO/acetyl esterase/lipase